MEKIDEIDEMRSNTESHAFHTEDTLKSKIDEIDGKKQGKMARYWIFVWNNYTMEDVNNLINILDHECEWYVFQEETGEEKTPHLQGSFFLKKQQRLTSLKKWNSKIHFEITKSVSASLAYSTKKATRTGQQWTKGIEVEEELEFDEPYGWQLKVLDIIKEKPDKRAIYWFWEPKGNCGKSELCKYLYMKHKALMLTGKSTDMFHILSKAKHKKIIIVDVPRTQQDYVNYGALEQIKNGFVCSGKYDGCNLAFNRPHLIIFANEPPCTHKMSLDRWHIYDIRELIRSLE